MRTLVFCLLFSLMTSKTYSASGFQSTDRKASQDPAKNIQPKDRGCDPYFLAGVDWTDNNHLSFLFQINSNTNPFIQYRLDFGDGSDLMVLPADLSGDRIVKHTFANGGLYKVCLMAKNTHNGCMSIYCKEVSVTTCSAEFTYTFDVATNTYTFFPAVTSSTSKYLWSFYDGTNQTTSTLTIPSFQGTPGTKLWVSLGLGSTIDPNCHDTTGIQILVTGIREDIHQSLTLTNYPNPFRSTTNIGYVLSATAKIEVNLLDLLGNKLAMIDSGQKESGEHVLEWDAGQLAKGMYLLQLQVGNQQLIRKMVIDK